MQASFEGQSASTLHSGSGSGSYAVQNKEDMIYYGCQKLNPNFLKVSSLRGKQEV